MDTNLPNEARRWVFAEPCEGLREFGREVSLPRHFLKLCGTVDDLRAVLPAAWHLQPESHFMIANDARSSVRVPVGAAARTLPDGYRLESERDGPTTSIRIVAHDGSLAASGYAAETMGVFIYDRIVTAPGHQRKGLGNIVMHALKSQRQSPNAPELLVATEEGRQLYMSLGWTVLSPFSTAEIPA
ncbi:GNAT family N-acetyltransferase [Novosphingobium sp. PhB165]|uniref:GNAT family N-acetyltransferase n=1 Tax=Novosphingobium sp. PhB165 TaxID=2485105 RepID=UPI001FB52E58|nr:GNAT family N-acetyltransferase [Novosphingobium sp. PhB165]